MSDINEKVLQEIIVTQDTRSFDGFSNLTKIDGINRETPADRRNIDLKTFTKYPLLQTTPWQDSIISRVTRNLDTFVNVSPSAGKSYPVQMAWKSMVLKAKQENRPIPKILWICENKTLATEVFKGFREQILDIAKDNPNIVPGIDSSAIGRRLGDRPGDLGFRTGELVYDPSRTNINSISNSVTSMVALKMLNSPGTITKDTIAVSCTYSYGAELVKNFNPKIIVIDEVQERFRVGIEIEELNEKVKSFIETLKAASPQSSFVILTGSMSHSTSESIKDYINSTFNRNFGMISTSLGYNRSAIGVVPIDELARADGKADFKFIKDLVVGQIRNRENNNLIIILSKNGIRDITKDIMQSTPKRTPEATVGARPGMRFSDVVKVDNPLYRHQNIEYKVGKGVNLKTLLDMIKEFENSPQKSLEHLRTMLAGGSTGDGGKCDKELGEALLHGVGYIMSETRNETTNQIITNYNPRDIALVSLLLKKGLISTVLSTTAVGVGVNLKIKRLYLPSTTTPSPKGFTSMDASTLVQLLNRAGRAQDDAATIFCTSKDFDRIVQYFGRGKHAGDPSSSVPIIPFKDNSGSSLMSRFRLATSKPDKLFRNMKSIYKMLVQL